MLLDYLLLPPGLDLQYDVLEVCEPQQLSGLERHFISLYGVLEGGYNLAKVGSRGATGKRNLAMQKEATLRLVALFSGVYLGRAPNVLSAAQEGWALRTDCEMDAVIEYLKAEYHLFDDHIVRMYEAVRVYEYRPYANLARPLVKWLGNRGFDLNRYPSLGDPWSASAVGVSSVLPWAESMTTPLTLDRTALMAAISAAYSPNITGADEIRPVNPLTEEPECADLLSLTSEEHQRHASASLERAMEPYMKKLRGTRRWNGQR
ncbi:MAG: hypothetical protein ACYC62_06630 [Coriobacteriia bacterium]